jgi:hypothetical protein
MHAPARPALEPSTAAFIATFVAQEGPPLSWPRRAVVHRSVSNSSSIRSPTLTLTRLPTSSSPMVHGSHVRRCNGSGTTTPQTRACVTSRPRPPCKRRWSNSRGCPRHWSSRPSRTWCGMNLNNMAEQDHHAVIRRVSPGHGVGSFPTAQRTLQGYEVTHMIRKGQLHGMGKGGILTQNWIIAQMFGLVA